MGHRTASEGYRVLICAPYGRDAESLVQLFRQEGYDASSRAHLDDLRTQVNEHLGVILLTEEALRTNHAALSSALASQPAWSEVPIVLLAARRRNPNEPLTQHQVTGLSSHAIILERPLGAASLVSAVASAMRSRQRQFQMRDRLTELESSRLALQTSEADLRTVADALPLLIAYVDAQGRYRFANRAIEAWLGAEPGSLLGQSVLTPGPDAQHLFSAPDIENALAGEPLKREWRLYHAGVRHDMEVRYLPHHAESGSVDGFHVFAVDITDRKHTEQILAERVRNRTAALEAEMQTRLQAEGALRQSQKMEAVGQLTGGIAHDFNNMLTGVLGALAILKRRIAAGAYNDLDRFMDAASTSAQRAASLTARLLAFSRRQSLDLKSVNLNELLRSFQELLRRSVRENIQLHIESHSEPLYAVVDANQLESALLNLVLNARDAMPDGGQLTIEYKPVDVDEAYVESHPESTPGRYVMISVSDTGVGMPPDLLERVFEPFFTTKPLGQGTGLGLSMVYGFARQAGGHVRIHSQPGIGTTVSLFLKAGAPATVSDSDQDAAAPEGQGQTVLLVEDDVSVRLIVRDVLEELAYTAIEAEDADTALPVLRSDRCIDLLISDVGLPGMNGRQLAEVARQHRPDLPILFITGYAENAAIRAGFLGTNMAMITKPFELEALAEKVSSMLSEQAETDAAKL